MVFPILKYLKIDAEKLAKLIGEYLIENNKNVESFNVVKGFLNLSLSDAFFFDRFSAIYEDKNFGHKILNKNSPKVMVEFSSPNTNKPLHLGHIRNNLLGYSISKILEADGKKVIKTQIISNENFSPSYIELGKIHEKQEDFSKAIYYYKIIDRSNAIIKGAELSNEVSEEMKILLSEARVLRAEAYFTLFRMFNNIYVTTEPTSPDNAFEKIKDKSSEEEIFELIKSDLNYAEQHLPWTNTPGRVNLAMAKHIDAKVSMWNQDWQGAINKTEDIFNSGFYSLMDNPADIFDGINNYGPRSSGAVNNETIFNFQFSNPTIGGGIKTMINWNFTANYGLVGGATYSRDFGGRGAGWVFPNQYLLSLYDEDDLRTKDIYFRLKKLIDEKEMGNLFKVMFIKNKGNKYKLGFN